MTNKHAIYSPSGFKALMLCPAKPAMERGLPDESSEYADEGTAAHELAATALTHGKNAADYIGQGIQVGDVAWYVTEEMAEAVQVYLNTVRDYLGDGTLFVEQSLPIGHITGEEGAEGTGDAIILRGNEIIVIDLKYGKGVEVEAEMNPQLMLYGLGALEKFDIVGDIERVRMVISQPRVSWAPSEFDMPAAALVQWGLDTAGPAANLAMQIYEFSEQVDQAITLDNCNPHEDACRFCKAKPNCPALARTVSNALEAEFTDLTTADEVEREQIIDTSVKALAEDQLGAKMDAVPLVELWCKAIRARVEKQLLDGAPVAGYKLVQGKKGNRAWLDAVDAEAKLKAMRLKKDEMYDLKLISPTTAEKVLKDSPKRWNKVKLLIGQSEGKPSVAPVSDKRSALEIKPVEAEFAAIESAEDLV